MGILLDDTGAALLDSAGAFLLDSYPTVVLSGDAPSTPFAEGGQVESAAPQVIRSGSALSGPVAAGGMIRRAGQTFPALAAKVFRHPDYTSPHRVLTGLSGYRWQDRVGETGHGSITIPNLHADQPQVTLDDLVRFEVKGHAAFTVTVATRDNRKHPKGDTEAPATSFEGPGHIGLLSEMVVLPSNGPGSLPIETDRLFSWPSPTFDDSSWVNALDVMAVGAAQAGGWPFQPMGDGFPPAFGGMIWAPGTTAVSAPGGDCYFRRKFTSPNAGRILFYVLIDNYGEIYLDGQQVLGVAPADGFTNVTTFSTDVSAGEHTIAAHCHNYPGDGPGGSDGPGALAVAVYDCDTNNVPTSPVPLVVTDATWKIVAYPPQPPGMTPGEVILLALTEAQALGYLEGWETTFTRYVDSDGQPWPTYGEIATKVGTDYLTFILDELAQTYCDVRAQPGGLVLEAVLPAGLGTTRPVDLHTATDPNTPSSGNVTEVGYGAQSTTATAFLARWQGGWRLVDSEPAGRKKMAVLGLGALPSETEVDRVAGGQLDRHSQPRDAVTTGFHPADDTETPYVGFGPGDTVTAPAETDGAPTPQRVMGITVTPDEAGTPVFALELIDVLRQQWERDATALKKLSDGTLRGDARPAQPAASVGFTGPGPNCCPPAPPEGGE